MHRPCDRDLLPLALLATSLLGTGCLGIDQGPYQARVPPDESLDAGTADASFDAGLSPGTRFHPTNYVLPDQHGGALMRQELDCRGCHGADLEGTAAGPSCDGCHTPATPKAWRTQCTFCHGGVDNMTGAPPVNLDGTRTAAEGRFPSHSIHVETTLARTIDCVECHVKAIDVLSPEHVFDATKGRAEVDFGTGLSRQGAFDPATGACSNNYCHGSGRGDDGRLLQNVGTMGCAGCHADGTSGPTGWARMSGLHGLHLSESGVTCAECHQGTTADGTSIRDAARHVNGTREVSFLAAGFTFAGSKQTCSGSCHGHDHTESAWISGSGGRFHPAGFSASTAHGPEMELGRMDCRSCHGPTLEGEAGAPSCDSCHQTGWRSNCVYCHGGGANTTGAPPRDLGALLGTASQSFRAHTAHVTPRMAAPFDCTQCHLKPTDLLSAGHAFDATQGKAEVSMAAGLSTAGTYDGAGGCASMYCHSNGRGDTGVYRDASAAVTCRSCHPDQASGPAAWATMSGDHALHLSEGVRCAECHATVTRDGTSILAPALHVDKQRQVNFGGLAFTYNAATRRCTGACHGEDHNETW